MIDYRQICEKFYNGDLLLSFEDGTNANYENAKAQKSIYSNQWEATMAAITKLNFVRRIRDFSDRSQSHTNKLMIGINELNEGIYLHISFLPMCIGIYFCHLTIKSDIPIKDHSVFLDEGISYFPFTEQQITFANEILNITQTFFDDFIIFNNLFAAIKAKNVIVDMVVRDNADCFQVIFDGYIGNII